MIRTITDTKNIPARISEVLEADNPRWLEKVLLLVGFYTSPRRAMRSIKVNGVRKARTKARQQKSATRTRKVKSAAEKSQALVPSIA